MIDRDTLPTDWGLLPLRRVLRQLNRSVHESDGVITAYRDGSVTLRSRRREEGYTFSDTEDGYQGVEAGDLVVHALDAFAGAVGVCDARGKCSPVYHVCEAALGDDLRFVAYALRAMGFTGFLALQAGNVRQRSVDFRTWDVFGRIPFARPPRDQQRRVADFLDAETSRIDALLERKRHMVDLFEERRVAVTDAAILKEDGAVRPVAALASYLNGWAFAPDDFTPTGLPVIRIAQLTDPSLETDLFDGELPDRVRLRSGDIVFSWSASLEVHVWDRGAAYLNQHLYRVLPKPGIDREWLRFALDAATRQFRGLMHGSAMTHITQPMMKLVRFPIPAETRQRELAAALSREWAVIDDAVDRLNRQIVLLREHRQALITAAVTGQLALAEATLA